MKVLPTANAPVVEAHRLVYHSSLGARARLETDKPASGVTCTFPRLSERDAHKTVKARFGPWLSGNV